MDLSGVIYVGNSVVSGADDAIERLRKSGLPVRFLTNTTRKPKAKLLAKLNSIGICVTESELFTPAQAARDWLHQHHRSPYLLIHPDLETDFEDLTNYPEKAIVVGDAGQHFNYHNLNVAFRELCNDAEFIALADNRMFKDSDGGLSLDAGPFVEALRYASQKEPIILGKPSRKFFQAAVESMSCPLANAVMVGDDAEIDVAGALSAGVGHGLLVRTGKYQEGVENSVKPKPTAIIDDLVQAVDWILNQVN